MPDELDMDQTFIRYIDQEMGDEEKEQFEIMLEENPAYRERLDNLLTAISGISYAGIQEQVEKIREEMNIKEEDFKPGRKSKVIHIGKAFRLGLVAAACIIFIMVGVEMYRYAPSGEKLYQQMYTDYTLSNTRGVADSGSVLEKDYKNKNYAAAITDAGSTKINNKDRLLLGLSYLKTGDYKNAEANLQFLSNSMVGTYSEDAQYYLALTYIKLKKYDLAWFRLKAIKSNPNHIYHSMVNDTQLTQLEKLKNRMIQ